MPDTKPFTDADARTGWNAGAAAWDAFVESGADYYRRLSAPPHYGAAPDARAGVSAS